MNQISIILASDASAEVIARAHAALNAFAGIALTTGSAAAVNEYVAPAPTKTVEQVAGAQANVELDVTGLPWDGRIHASTKTKTQKGEWTKLKGCDDATRDTVMAQLRSIYPAPVATMTAGPTPAAAVASIGVPNVSINIAPKTEYQKLVDFIATNVGAKLPQEVIDATFNQNGTSLAALAGNEEHSQAYREAFEAHLKSVG